MGRGRSKAKQTKLERLAKELHGENKEDKGFNTDSSDDNYTPRN